jgi:hypothetical protein
MSGCYLLQATQVKRLAAEQRAEERLLWADAATFRAVEAMAVAEEARAQAAQAEARLRKALDEAKGARTEGR